MDSAIDPLTLSSLHGALNAAVMRHSVHAHNIANAHTPGFKARTVSFQDSFDLATQQAAASSAGAQDGGQPVNVAGEVAAMTENSLQYQALVRLLNRELAIASIALNDGKR